MVTRALHAECLPRRLAARRAFALIEAVVAVVILGVALSVVLGLIGRAIASQSKGEHLETAARLADERLNLVLASGPEGYESVFPLAGQCEAPFERYRYELVIEPSTAGEPSRVVATVSWVGPGGRPDSVSIETRIAPRRGEDPDPERAPQETTDRAAR